MHKSIKRPRAQYLMVLFSSGVALVLSFVLNIVFTHTMETTDFGYYRAFVNSITMLCTLASLGFSLTFARDFAICKDVQEKKSLTGAALVINITISLMALVVIFTAAMIARWLNIEIPSYLVFASAALWLMLLNRFYLFRYQGENDILMYAVLTVAPQLLLTGVIATFFVLGIPVSRTTAIFSYLLSYILLYVFFILREIPVFKNVKADMPAILKKNSGYGFHMYVGGLASVASSQLMNLMVAPLSGLDAYAHFTLGVSLASPIMQIPAIMGTISFKQNVKRDKIPVSQILLTVGMSVAAVVVYTLFLKYLICYLIGDKYLGAISYATIMVYYYVLMGLGDYFNRFISAKGYGKEIRNSSFVVGVSLLLSAIIFVPLFKINGVILAETISGAVYLLLMVTKYLKILKMESEC